MADGAHPLIAIAHGREGLDRRRQPGQRQIDAADERPQIVATERGEIKAKIVEKDGHAGIVADQEDPRSDD